MNMFGRKLVPLFVVSLLVACSDGMTESQHLAKAKEFSDGGELKAASIELKNALQKNPDNPLTRFELGKLHLKVGDMATAEKELSKALALGVGEDKVLPYLARSLLRQGKHADVMALSLKNLEGESKSEILAQKGLSLVARGDMTKAKYMIDRAMGVGQVSIHAMVANALVLGYEKDFKKSREQLDAVFKIDPDFAQAWSILGDIELNANNKEAAVEAITKAISLRINNLPDMLKRATILIQMKQFDAAQKDADYLKDRIPLHPGFNYLQGIIHFHKNNYQDAQATFDLALVDEKRYPMALYYAGLTNYLLGQRERADKYATNYFARFPDYPPARKLLAIIKLSQLKFKEVEELLRPLLETNTNDIGAMNILATALLKQGESNEAVDLLSKIVALNPDSPEAQMRLGVGHMISGDAAAGEEHLLNANKMESSDRRGDILLILNYIRQKQFDRALEKAKAFNEQFPEEASSHNVLGRVFLLTDKKQEAKAAFTKALQLEPGNPSASQNLAAMALSNKDYAEARDYYLKALEKHSSHLSILMRLAALDSIEKKMESMVSYLQRAIEMNPKTIEPRLVLARYYLSEGKGDQVAILVRDFDQMQMRTPSAMELISLSQLADGNYSGARNTLKKYLVIKPKSAYAHHWMAKALAGLGKHKEMRAALEQSIELAPKYLPPRMVLALYLVQTGENELAAEHVAVLNKLAPEHPEILKLGAAMALSSGNTKSALEFAASAYKNAPTTKNMLTLANIKWNAKDQDGSIQLKKDWLMEHPDDINARLALAGNYVIKNMDDATVEQYKMVLDRDSNNLVALNNLAWFLRLNEPKKALQYARLAIDLQPKSSAIMDTLAIVLLENNHTAEAVRVIKNALIKGAKNPAIQYHAAKIFTAAGNEAEAIRVLRVLVNSGVKFPEQKEAETLLKELQEK